MDINWSKTFFMIVTAKHKSKMVIPAFIKKEEPEVAITDKFKLLGVLIDNDLNFDQHVVNICEIVKKNCLVLRSFPIYHL